MFNGAISFLKIQDNLYVKPITSYPRDYQLLSIISYNSSGNDDNKVVNKCGESFYKTIINNPFPYPGNVPSI